MFGRKTRAPELIDLHPKAWINSEPLTLEQLRGKVVLLDFWTYSCVNCLRTLPALKALWEKYQKKRVVILGVHTPEFAFEKEMGNVKYAVKKHGITYPVVNDPERKNWERYGNTYWPRAALIDTDGQNIFNHVGETGYDEIEQMIVQELRRVHEIRREDDVSLLAEKKRVYAYGMTQETYAGSLRSKGIGSGTVCDVDGCEQYVDNGQYTTEQIHLQGQWKQEEEYLIFTGDVTKGKHWLAMRYYASEVHAVLDGQGSVEVLLDGKPLTKLNAGKDVCVENGKSYVDVGGADMYTLVSSKAFHTGIITLVPCEELKVFAFTFG